MKLRYRIIIFSVTLSLTLICQLSAAPQRKTIQVVYTDWFPYTYEQNGVASGFEIEIAEAVFRQINVEPVFIKFPWKRCLSSIRSGEADALISMLKTSERKVYTRYPDEHISISKTVFFTSKNNLIPYNGSLTELKDYTIGTIMGFSYGDEFDNADYLKKDDVLDAQKLIKKVITGRNDLGAENQAVIKAYALGLGEIETIRFLEPPIHTSKLFVGFSKINQLEAMTNEFSECLRKFKLSDEYKGILKTYGIELSEME